jgi:SPP1 family predicted phage head-tail adaptor
MIQPGALNKHITIIKNTGTTSDAYNNPVPVWTDSSTRWAQVITEGGREFYAAQRVQAETKVLFKLRYTNAIDVKDRIRYDGKVYEILSVTDVNAGRVELNISAKEVS